MNTLKKTLFALALVLALASASFSATITQTVASAAITATAATVTVASTTGISASTQLQTYLIWVDGELMKVNTVITTSGVLGVTRGLAPTRGTAHATASIVFFGPAGAVPFVAQNPFPGSVCTATSYAILPLMNPSDGTLSNCLASGNGGSRWVAYNFRQWAYGHPVTPVIDVAYTATLADEFIAYTSLTATRILTLPAITGVVGKTIIVSINGTGTSQVTITPVNGQTIGPAAATTIAQTGAGSVTRLISLIGATGLPTWGTW